MNVIVLGVVLSILVYIFNKVYISKREAGVETVIVEGGVVGKEIVELLTLPILINEFKKYKLREAFDLPFVSNGKCELLGKIKKMNGYEVILIGIYDQSNDSILGLKVFYAKSVSNDILNLFDKEDLVVLK